MCNESLKQTDEIGYLKLVEDILANGEQRIDRTGVGTYALFGKSLSFDLSKGFPLLTTKQMSFKSILGEMLWFIEGSGDERRLAEITFGTRDTSKKTIWTANATSDYWLPKAKFEGDLGRVYGVQWRDWKTVSTNSDGTFRIKHTDQLDNVINSIKNNPTDRRIILTALNPGEFDQMALPPCHLFVQFFVSSNKTLSAQLYMRSVDVALGLPYNIASYAFLTHMIAQVCNLTVGKLTIVMGDTHIYSNHIEGLKEQITRQVNDFPTLKINSDITDIDSFKMTDFEIRNYQFHPSIKFDMAV